MSNDDKKKPTEKPGSATLPLPAVEEVPIADLEQASGGVSDCCCVSGCTKSCAIKAD